MCERAIESGRLSMGRILSFTEMLLGTCPFLNSSHSQCR